MNPAGSGSERRRRLLTRALPLGAVAVVAFIAGAGSGAQGDPEKDAARRFIEAWVAQDFEAMRAELSDTSQAETTLEDLTNAYLAAQSTATLEAIDPGEPADPETEGGTTVVPVPVGVDTIAFGEVDGEIRLSFQEGEGGGIVWDPSLVFPGLQEGEELSNDVRLGRRAPILARDGTPLAEGPPLERSSPLGSEAIDVVGEVGEPDPADADALAAQGFPPGTPVGITGLELAFNSRLAGRPGGRLLAGVPGSDGTRVLAEAPPAPGKPVKTWIDPEVQEAAVIALAGRIGGIAVLDARRGNVVALAGTAFSAPRPPGSTFKIITTVAALEEDAVKLDEVFPIVSGANVGGRFISNASGEYCGGTFPETFAHSCNSVFAPLGVEVGEDDLVDAAVRFGFNSPPSLYDDAAMTAVDPPNSDIPEDPGDDLDLGVSAIGQGEVLATPLEMASVAQTIANGGVRMPTPIARNPELQPDAKPVRVTTRKIAKTVTELMVDVVEYGTGTAAAIPEGQVAGKTGTAELGPQPDNPDVQILDAWFTAFAPADNPRLAVAVMLNDAGAAGGDVAAPAAAQVLSAGL